MSLPIDHPLAGSGYYRLVNMDSVEVSSTFVQQHIPQVLDNHALLTY